MELKKCPFCGGGAEIKMLSHGTNNRDHIINSYVVECRECGIRTNIHKSDIYQTAIGEVVVAKTGVEEAAKEWNTRVEANE